MEMRSIDQVAAQNDSMRLKNCSNSFIKANKAKNMAFVMTKKQPLYNSGTIALHCILSFLCVFNNFWIVEVSNDILYL